MITIAKVAELGWDTAPLATTRERENHLSLTDEKKTHSTSSYTQWKWHATGGTGRTWDSQALVSHSSLNCLHSITLGLLANSYRNRGVGLFL